MSNLRGLKQLLVVGMALGLLAGCSRDPNVRKQKYFESGSRYFEKEKYREAAIQYSNAIQVEPRYADAHYQLARCYLKSGVWSGAYSELLRTVDLQPTNWKAQIDLGNLLLAARQFTRAQERAELVLRSDPNDVDAHILLANSYAALENLEASLQEMQTAIQLAPDRPQSYLNLALLQLNSRQTAPAEESFKKAVSLDPQSVPAVIALGNFYQQQRRWSEAELQFRRAIELEPKNHIPRAALARLDVVQGQKAQAEQVLIEAKEALRGNPDGYRLLGDFYFGVGDLEKALAEYSSLYRDHPRDKRVKKNYIQLLILRGQLDAASKLNDEILKENPKEAEGLIYRGQILNRQGHPNDAIPVFEIAVKSEADNALAHYHLGIAFSLLGNLGRAEAEWREAARLRPNLAAAQQALAGIALRKGDIDMLKSSAEELIRVEPFSPTGYVLRAAAELARGEQVPGEADLKKAIDVAPQNPIGYARLGMWRASQKRFGEAEKLYEQALEREPNFTEALQGLVGIHFLQKESGKALARVNAQIAKAPNNSTFYFILAQVLLAGKDLEKAEVALQKAVEFNKNNVEAFLALAQVQTARGSIDRAIPTYERSIQENPRDVRSYVLLGALEESRGNWQRAEQLYQKALQVEPDYPLAANNLAYLMLERGRNIDVAVSLAQVARTGLPESPNAADTLAWAYYNKGAYGLATGLLEEAVKKVPTNPTYHYHLALSYQKTNDRARARAHFLKVLEINPQDARAGEIRKLLAEMAGD